VSMTRGGQTTIKRVDGCAPGTGLNSPSIPRRYIRMSNRFGCGSAGKGCESYSSNPTAR
jgi:hypothetical protein